MGLYLPQDLGLIPVLLALDIGAEANALLIQAVLNDLIQTLKGAAADEEDVLGVDLDELLMGVLPAALA